MKIILFDIDGTLISAGTAPRRAFERAFREILGVSPVTAGVRTHGATDPQIQQDTAVATLGRSLTNDECTSLNVRYVELLYSEIEWEAEYKIMPGVASLLDYLARQERVALGLQTGNLVEAVPAKLNRGGLSHYFASGGFGSDSFFRVDIIRAAIDRTRAVYAVPSTYQPEVVVIGDAPQDMSAALEVGARPIGVTTGIFTADELAAAGPCTVLRDLSNLHEVISLIGGIGLVDSGGPVCVKRD